MTLKFVQIQPTDANDKTIYTHLKEYPNGDIAFNISADGDHWDTVAWITGTGQIKFGTVLNQGIKAKGVSLPKDQ